jgi:hypothetical protein
MVVRSPRPPGLAPIKGGRLGFREIATPVRILAIDNLRLLRMQHQLADRDGKAAEWLALGADSYLALVQKYRESARGSG